MATTTAPTTNPDQARLEALRTQRETLQAQQQVILQKRDQLQGRLDQANADLEKTRTAYSAECRALAEGRKDASPSNYQAKIAQLEALIEGLKPMIEEGSAANVDLGQQIGLIVAEENGINWRLRDLELLAEFNSAQEAEKSAMRAHEDARRRVSEAAQRRADHH